MEPPPGLTVVLEDDRGVILGTAKMGPNRPGAGAHIGTASFMVAPTARGRGVGRALAEFIVRGTATTATAASSSTPSSRPTPTPSTCGRRWASRSSAPSPDAFLSPTQGYVGLHVMFLDLTGPDPAQDPDRVV